MEAVCSSQTLVPIYKSTQRCNPEDKHFSVHTQHDPHGRISSLQTHFDLSIEHCNIHTLWEEHHITAQSHWNYRNNKTKSCWVHHAQSHIKRIWSFDSWRFKLLPSRWKSSISASYWWGLQAHWLLYAIVASPVAFYMFIDNETSANSNNKSMDEISSNICLSFSDL
jgi:hypothetical protein